MDQGLTNENKSAIKQHADREELTVYYSFNHRITVTSSYVIFRGHLYNVIKITELLRAF